MALTEKQTEGIVNLFVTAFVNSTDELDRKKILIEFEDAFGKSISGWKSICREKLRQYTSDDTIISCFDKIVNRKEQTDIAEAYAVRMMEETDIKQVREIINAAFKMCLTSFDDEKLKKFVESNYSVVAYHEDEIAGVALAFEMPDYAIPTIYLDTFAVAENVRGYGIGKKMLRYIQKLGRERGLGGKIKLQTDRKIDAYQIYKHWGFQEDELVHMHSYFV